MPDFGSRNEFHEFPICKLSFIVFYKGFWYPISTYEIAPQELPAFCSRDDGEWFSLDTLSEVIDCNYEILDLPRG